MFDPIRSAQFSERQWQNWTRGGGHRLRNIQKYHPINKLSKQSRRYYHLFPESTTTTTKERRGKEKDFNSNVCIKHDQFHLYFLIRFRSKLLRLSSKSSFMFLLHYLIRFFFFVGLFSYVTMRCVYYTVYS